MFPIARRSSGCPPGSALRRPLSHSSFLFCRPRHWLQTRFCNACTRRQDSRDLSRQNSRGTTSAALSGQLALHSAVHSSSIAHAGDRATRKRTGGREMFSEMPRLLLKQQNRTERSRQACGVSATWELYDCVASTAAVGIASQEN